MGVDLFFVLSGFLIAGLLFREQKEHGEIRIGRFYIRRGLKIYPPFYLLIAITLVRDWWGGIPIKPDHLAAECFLSKLSSAAGWQLPFLVRAVLYVTLSFGLGIILSRLVEFPVLKLRDRVFPSRSSALRLAQ
jgi:peptidoglycan/LPS O-acetylase OafA/YrhL